MSDRDLIERLGITPGEWVAYESVSAPGWWNVCAPDPSEHAEEGDLSITAEGMTRANANAIAATHKTLIALEAAAEVIAELKRRLPNKRDWRTSELKLDAAITAAYRKLGVSE